MAEFSRKGRNRRILESINTKKSTRQEVYDFYIRTRRQLMGNKFNVGTKLDRQSKKSDIVNEIDRLLKMQNNPNAIVDRYVNTYKGILKSRTKSRRSFALAEDKIQNMQRQLLYDLNTTKGLTQAFIDREDEEYVGGLMLYKDTPLYKANYLGADAYKHKSMHVHTDLEGKKYYKEYTMYGTARRGKMAQDAIAYAVEQGWLKTEEYDDSQDMFSDLYAMAMNDEMYELYEEIYLEYATDDDKKIMGTSQYYNDFIAFLEEIEEWEISNNMQGMSRSSITYRQKLKDYIAKRREMTL